MCKMLMSIKPVHVENILAGRKRFEFRKTRCKKDIDSIIIYSTAPIMQVVAEVEVTGVIEDTPERVWECTADEAGIDKSFFDQYYEGREHAVAYALGSITRYPRPRSLTDYGVRSAPQSFLYIKDVG